MAIEQLLDRRIPCKETTVFEGIDAYSYCVFVRVRLVRIVFVIPDDHATMPVFEGQVAEHDLDLHLCSHRYIGVYDQLQSAHGNVDGSGRKGPVFQIQCLWRGLDHDAYIRFFGYALILPLFIHTGSHAIPPCHHSPAGSTAVYFHCIRDCLPVQYRLLIRLYGTGSGQFCGFILFRSTVTFIGLYPGVYMRFPMLIKIHPSTISLVVNSFFSTLLVFCLALASASTAWAQPVSGAEKIIVSGASGQLGGLAVKELLNRGVAPENLILVSRTTEPLKKYAEMGASVRFGDFTQPESLQAAYAGGDRMLLISINSGGDQRPELHKRAIDAAVAAGVRHIAYTSFVNMDHNTSTLAGDHRRTEEFLKASGVAWTMLRNHVYMEALLNQAKQMLASAQAVIPQDETPMGYVTRGDCAAAAAAVLSTPGHENQAYDITGPDLIGQRGLAEAVTAVTGKAIKITQQAPGEAGGQGGFRLTGDYLRVTSTAVAELTGRPATSIRTFLEANRDKLNP